MGNVSNAKLHEDYADYGEQNNDNISNIIRISAPDLQRQRAHGKHTKLHNPIGPIHLTMPTIDEDESIVIARNKYILRNEEKEFSLEEISKHNQTGDVWIVLNNNVYDVTDFWPQHPVNPQYVFKYGGKDATNAFNSAGHSEYAEKLAENMKIGVLAKSDRMNDLYHKKMSVVNWNSLEETDLDSQVTIKHIFVYPVKGCGGVQVESSWIDQSGVFNDRTYCFVDADTHNPINQLKYQKLALIQPILKNIHETQDMHCIELYYLDEKTDEKNSIIVKSKYNKNDMIEIEFINSDTKILSYDQGDEISNWITKYLHSTMNIENKNKRFRFCKILRNNFRSHKDYFSLPFIDKQDQPIKGILNYSAINMASQESLNELNRRWYKKYPDKEAFGWETWRVNIVLEGLPEAHFEDYTKFVTINNDVELLWNRRRYMCTVPNVIQSTGIQTNEPQNTLTRYRNALTLNDTTAKPGTNGVFFGSFFLIKQGGQIRVGDYVDIKQTQFNILRTNRQISYYGDTNLAAGDKNFQVKTLTQYQSYKLSEKEQLTHDTYHLRFELAGNTSISLQHESLRLNIGGHYLLKIPDNINILPVPDNPTQHIHVDDHDIDEKTHNNNNTIPVIRAYTPIILDANNENENYFDLIVKIYAKGKMTQYLQNMQIGDLIDAKQYYGGIRYIEIGTFRFGDPSHFQVKHWTFNVNYINMICGGTGICPMMQIIQCIHNNKMKNNIDNTKINVFISNKTINDILLVNQLNEIEKINENIQIYYVITSKEDKAVENKNQQNINHLKITQFGKRIDSNFIQKYAFRPTDDCIVLLCGPPKMDIAMNKYCQQIGYNEKRIHTF